jgi:uncharacterized protein DUF6949
VPAWDEGRTAVLREGLLLLYCTVIGFVASGITASFFKMVTTKPARFGLLGDGAAGLATTFAFCAVTGPAIIVESALSGSLPRSNTLAWLAGALFVALLWSACSGILIVDLLYSIRGTI